MSDRFVPLIPAQLAFDAHGVPVSDRYGDVYHSRFGALAQARHVFLTGNQLPARWQGRAQFTVCETGFGTGNNFLALWQAWRDDPARCARLHMLSFEGHPFDAAAMAQLAARCDPEIRPLADALAEAWPILVPGIHRLEFEAGAVTLTLVFGPIERMARQADACADAFFLDGFAPDRNPEMWTPALFGQLARMAAPGATAATWCSAVVMRKALGNAGFLVSRVRGFARKCEMTIASLRPGMGRVSAGLPGGPVLVVGAGMAGAAMAHALSSRGHDCLVFDAALADGPAGRHQGHRTAAMSPVLTIDDDMRTRLCRAGVLNASRRWAELDDSLARPVACGTLEVTLDAQVSAAQRKAVDRLGFPAEWVRWLDAGQAGELAGLRLPHGGLWFPQGRLVRPSALLPALLQRVQCRAARVASLRRESCGDWSLLDQDGHVLACAPTVVLANAGASRTLLASVVPGLDGLQRLAAMQDLAGQVSHFRAGPDDVTPRLILAGNGYWLPADAGRSTGGSTYVAMARDLPVPCLPQGHAEVIGKLAVLSGVPAAVLQQQLCAEEGWSGWRAAMADHLPVVGRVAGQDGLWMAAAFGSRGLSWASLAGDIVAAQLGAEPLPIERELLRRITPR